MPAANRTKELENVLLDQIEKLNDDSIFKDPDEAKTLIERSKAISALTDSFVEVSRVKLDAVRELNKSGAIPAYERFLGIESREKAK